MRETDLTGAGRVSRVRESPFLFQPDCFCLRLLVWVALSVSASLIFTLALVIAPRTPSADTPLLHLRLRTSSMILIATLSLTASLPDPESSDPALLRG